MSGSFGEFYKLGVPENRWFGVEISFNNDMDQLFGLSNNKQNVTFTQTIDDPGEAYDLFDSLLCAGKICL